METKRNQNCWLAIAVLLVALSAISSPVSAYPDGWFVIQLTDNNEEDGKPKISGSNVAWVQYDGHDAEIFFYDGTSIIQLTDNDGNDWGVDISGSNVTWHGYDGPVAEIFLYDGDTVTQLTNNSTNDAESRVCGSRVVWMGHDGYDWEIFLYDGGITQLTYNDEEDYCPVVSDSIVAWEWRATPVVSDYEIFMYDGNSITQLTDHTNSGGMPEISGSRIVWHGYDGGLDAEIFFYDGATTTQLTNNTASDFLAQISGKNITWQSQEGTSDKEIFFYDGLMSNQLTNNTWDDEEPKISGSHVVWMGDKDIFSYDGSTTVRVTDTPDWELFPDVSGRTVVWTVDDGHDCEIFLARMVCKMHWPQTPKASGFDLDIDSSVALGDDWRCTETGPVKDIRLWASWNANVVGAVNSLKVHIYSDQPAGASHSHPKDLLWEREFKAADLTVVPMDPNWQGWYEPNGMNTIANDHNQWCRIDIEDINDPFMQQEGEIYWLVISDADVNGGRLGWKETDKAFNDAAVWLNTATSTWQQILDPWFGGPIDLAFVIMDVPRPPQELDFGDAPNPPYQTLLNFGARHVIDPCVCLGSAVDSELNGQASADALGDDSDSNDDEDGVVFLTPLIPTQTAKIEVTASVAGYLDAWIDFDGDGNMTEATDQIYASEPLSPGNNVLEFVVPSTALRDVDTFARFRFSTTGGLDFKGVASDGEVEDYQVHVLKGHVPNLKWSQPPIEIDPTAALPLYCGWDQVSYSIDPNDHWHLVVDDFRCVGTMPVTSVHWWGSFLAWDKQYLPYPRPQAWRIGFWSNVSPNPSDDPNFSRPEKLLWQIEIPAYRVQVEWVGTDYFPEIGEDSCFQFTCFLQPTEYFWQRDHETQDNVFWLSIAAVYEPDSSPNHHWGWKTRPQHWMDNAIRTEHWGTLELETVLDPCYMTPIKDIVWEQSYDMAFELDTRFDFVKWEQPFTGLRNWALYEDEQSLAIEDRMGQLQLTRLVADDWPCRAGTAVTAIAWCGSYMGYAYEACVNPASLEQRVPPDYFILSIWTDVPDPNPGDSDTFSHPGQILWEHRAYNYDEVLVGFDKNPAGDPNEAVFRYSVELPEANRFRQQAGENVYWLSIVAAYKAENEPTHTWGWTNHYHVYNDNATASGSTTGTWPPVPAELDWQEVRDEQGQGADMSFALYTDPSVCSICPDYDSSGLIDLFDVKTFSHEWLWTGWPGGYNVGDLDCDGDVEFTDYALFALLWLESCP